MRTSSWRAHLPHLVTLVGLCLLSLAAGFASPTSAIAKTKENTCQINSPQGNVKHVIYLQFDNVHLSRDNQNVPSDLEQMPNLLNFITSHGTMLSNQHTPLIAHTATDILTTLTGVYPSRNGVPVSNSYRYFNPDGTSNPAVSFAYWTSPLYDYSTSTPSDTKYTMLDEKGNNTPAPWVSYTRAGCNFGAVATANTVLENIGVDIPTVFGANSPEATEVKANPDQATADYVGIAVHCAQGSSVCAKGQTDVLPNEPGGYTNYQGLFGHKYVAPQISPDQPLTDLDGNVIQSAKGNVGFPGFDGMSASTSLAYVAAMQEHNIPVTYAYISDAHDNHEGAGAYGPGSAGYVNALKSYDEAFGKFFQRLNADGINASNTLFVFTADEGDHFVGGAPTPANCDGVTVPCSYSQIGEVNVNLTGLLATQKQNTTPFLVHADSAPNFYITGNPKPGDQVTRKLEQDTASLQVTNPLTNQDEKLTNYLADPVEMNTLHMITSDPARTPNFTLFAKPDYYGSTGAPNCTKACVYESPAFAWNHGDVSPDINRTWLGLVGPGVAHLGINDSIWADHTDVRPTMMLLLGLKDDYRHDGRVLFEALNDKALPAVIQHNRSFYTRLAQYYKQINAPVGDFGLTTLEISTQALASSSTNDETYQNLEQAITSLTTQRDALALQMITLLENAEFGGNSHHNEANIQQGNLFNQGDALLRKTHSTH
ncbi:hypothetical protein KSD_19520 [Ktedonobacter sp. SOSP1-85]|uniref:hypothetical protein n=1 Tax=Ktedonobacter sp. SOSP1-85 TaxID=2778367 RepID=UPI001915E9B1|nr:hypothetical protein [Ktedonobacter sp. SOSP1-85]GHO74181.1 hypothetical protein KSD_19520 [Ktedonobacter sp. SOSP1-85]